MKQTIFYLEGRDGMYLYHFIILNLGGLYYICNNIFNNRGPSNSSVLFEDKSKIINKPSNLNLSVPIKIHMKNIIPFQREAFEIIKDKFELIEDLSIIDDYEIVSIYGETCVNHVCDNPNKICPFIRDLFLEKMNYNIKPGKRIFITRKCSEKYHDNVLKRYILNEKEIMSKLEKYNFEFVQLEDYNFHDKIKLFMESELIISSHSGALTFSLFLNKNATIIEILNKGTNGFPHDNYLEISKALNLNYNRYTAIYEDINGNFNLNYNKFELYLNKFI